MLGEVEVAAAEHARRIRGRLVVVGEDVRRVDRVGDGLDPTSFSQSATSASVSIRTWRVVVQSSILAFRPFFSRMPSAPTFQPAASRIDLAFSGSNVAGVWSAKNQAPGEMFVLATWTVPPRSRVLISFLSIA